MASWVMRVTLLNIVLLDSLHSLSAPVCVSAEKPATFTGPDCADEQWGGPTGGRCGMFCTREAEAKDGAGEWASKIFSIKGHNSAAVTDGEVAVYGKSPFLSDRTYVDEAVHFLGLFENGEEGFVKITCCPTPSNGIFLKGVANGVKTITTSVAATDHAFTLERFYPPTPRGSTAKPLSDGPSDDSKSLFGVSYGWLWPGSPSPFLIAIVGLLVIACLAAGLVNAHFHRREEAEAAFLSSAHENVPYQVGSYFSGAAKTVVVEDDSVTASEEEAYDEEDYDDEEYEEEDSQESEYV